MNKPLLLILNSAVVLPLMFSQMVAQAATLPVASVQVAQAAQQVSKMQLEKALQAYKSQDYATANALVTQLINQNPDFNQGFAYYLRGLMAYEQNQPQDALKDFNEAIAISDKNPYYYYDRARTYTKLREYNKALADFTISFSRSPNDLAKKAYPYNARGVAYLYTQNLPAARQDFQKAVEISPDFKFSWYNLSRVYNEQQEHSQALLAAKKAIALDSEYDAAFYQQGLAYEGLGDFEKALESFDEALKIYPEWEDYFFNERGLTHLGLNHYAEARQDFQKALGMNPKNYNALNNLGLSYYREGIYDKALESFQKTIALNPNFATVYYNQGLTYKALKRYPEAIAAYTKSIELYPDDSNAYNNRGLVYASQKQFDEALKDLFKAYEINPQDKRALNNIGDIYRRQKKYTEARNYIKKALELDAEYVLALDNLGMIDFALKDYAQAARHFEKALALDPSRLATRNDLGVTYRNLKQYDRARAIFDEILKKHPNNALALANIGRVERDRGNCKLAEEFFKKACEKGDKKACDLGCNTDESPDREE